MEAILEHPSPEGRAQQEEDSDTVIASCDDNCAPDVGDQQVSGIQEIIGDKLSSVTGTSTPSYIMENGYNLYPPAIYPDNGNFGDVHPPNFSPERLDQSEIWSGSAGEQAFQTVDMSSFYPSFPLNQRPENNYPVQLGLPTQLQSISQPTLLVPHGCALAYVICIPMASLSPFCFSSTHHCF